jgi:phage-related protein
MPYHDPKSRERGHVAVVFKGGKEEKGSDPNGASYALFVAQMGERPRNAKPLKGFKGSGVLEIGEDYDGDTFRAVYTVRFAQRLYVLHAFQKQSKRGIETPKSAIRLVEQRLRAAEEDHLQRQQQDEARG